MFGQNTSGLFGSNNNPPSSTNVFGFNNLGNNNPLPPNKPILFPFSASPSQKQSNFFGSPPPNKDEDSIFFLII